MGGTSGTEASRQLPPLAPAPVPVPVPVPAPAAPAHPEPAPGEEPLL